MKKTRDTTSITNERKGASLHFTRKRQEKQQTQKPPVAMPDLPQDVPVSVPLYPLDVLSDNDNHSISLRTNSKPQADCGG
jgi:hypothetical protein